MNDREIWYRQKGFFNNPFSIKPAAFYDDLIGKETLVRKVNHSIATNRIVYVEGDYGYGKTTLLRQIINRFGGRGRIIYFSCNRIEDRLNIEKLLVGRYGLLGKLFNLRAKKMILLLDEAHWLSKEDYNALVRYYRGGYLCSIVFVGKDFNESIFPDGLRGMLDRVKLSNVAEEDAVRVIRNRIGSLPMLSDETIRLVYRSCGRNVRLLLKSCELLCRHAHERGEDEVTVEMVGALFGKEGVDAVKKEAEAEDALSSEEAVSEELPRGQIEDAEHGILERQADEGTSRLEEEIPREEIADEEQLHEGESVGDAEQKREEVEEELPKAADAVKELLDAPLEEESASEEKQEEKKESPIEEFYY